MPESVAADSSGALGRVSHWSCLSWLCPLAAPPISKCPHGLGHGKMLSLTLSLGASPFPQGTAERGSEATIRAPRGSLLLVNPVLQGAALAVFTRHRKCARISPTRMSTPIIYALEVPGSQQRRPLQSGTGEARPLLFSSTRLV